MPKINKKTIMIGGGALAATGLSVLAIRKIRKARKRAASGATPPKTRRGFLGIFRRKAETAPASAPTEA